MRSIIYKTRRMKEVEEVVGQSIETYLHRRFVDEDAGLHEISSEINVSYRIVLKWLDSAGIYSRRLGLCQKVHKKS